MRWLERPVEKLLWGSRFLVLLAVLGSLASSLAIFYLVTTDVVTTIVHLLAYADPRLDAGARAAMKLQALKHIVAIVDGYLLAAVLLIFALGLYEIFISKLDVAQESAQSSHVLVIRSLDDLKSRLGKVILIILVVSFFEKVLTMPVSTPSDLAWMAGSIALIGAALWLSHAGAGGGAAH